MTGDPRKLSVTYLSGIYVRDPTVLSTLAVFYDEIWLPHPYGGFDKQGIKFNVQTGQDREAARTCYWSWDWHPLFDAGILRTIPRPVTLDDDTSELWKIVRRNRQA